MHKVKRMCHVVGIKPPQCQAIRENSYANDKVGMDKRCEFSAKYWFDGERLCSRHASVKALRIMLET